MKTVQEIYSAYRIMPFLQLHQLRVAAVGKMVCDSFSGPIDANAVILACLFHDMGNIIKSDLVTFPDMLEPEGFEYWKGIKDEFVRTYGSDEHHATIDIAKEVGLPERVIAYIDGVGFSKLKSTRDSGSYEQKLVQYADCRVAPRSILPVRERLEDARVRYAGRKANNDMPEARQQYESFVAAAVEIEEHLFARSALQPEAINDRSAEAIIEELRNYPVA